MIQLDWTRGSAPDRTPRLPISVVNVTTEKGLNVRFLGSPWCCFVHGKGRRSFPCVRPRYVCPFCETHQEQIPAGYAAAQFYGKDANDKIRWMTCVISLSDRALDQLRDKDLRGKVYLIQRTTKAYNAPLRATFLQEGQIGLPDEFDPIPVVLQCWANYLATFTEASAAAMLASLDKAEAILDQVIKSAADHMAENVDQADQARDGKRGAM